MSRKSTIKGLRAKCDKLFSMAVFKFWGDKCTICRKEATATHHFIPKSLSAYLRYEVKNGCPLCYYDHIIRIHTQGDPRAIETIIEARGKKWHEEIKTMRKAGESKGGYLGVKYYKDKIEEFKKEYGNK